MLAPGCRRRSAQSKDGKGNIGRLGYHRAYEDHLGCDHADRKAGARADAFPALWARANMCSRARRTFFSTVSIVRLLARPRTSSNATDAEPYSTGDARCLPRLEVVPTLSRRSGGVLSFLRRYNYEHRHAQIGMVTSHQKHSGGGVIPAG